MARRRFTEAGASVKVGDHQARAAEVGDCPRRAQRAAPRAFPGHLPCADRPLA
ncbi:hypothetical protein [Amycolatopsis plumensis]|uniref:hypothetical protein n=1 Tax=Amycolatopsis plumensis TaxID=236508 RepID=UPI003608F431